MGHMGLSLMGLHILQQEAFVYVVTLGIQMVPHFTTVGSMAVENLVDVLSS
jgi:hypothetical protein